MKKIIILLLGVFFFSACENPYLVKKSTLEKQIEAVRLEYAKKLDDKTKELSEAKNTLVTSKDNQLQSAANAFFAINKVFGSIPSPLRTDLIINNYSNEGWAAVDNRMPTYQVMIEINKRIEKELDETKTSLNDLKVEHDKVMIENTKLAENAKTATENVQKIEAEKTSIQLEANKTIEDKEKELNQVNNQIIAAKDKQIENDKSLRDIKIKFSAIMGVLSLAALAGAVYSPIWNQKFGIFSAAMALGAIGIWYVEPWHIAVAVGALILGLGIWAWRNHYISTTSETNVYRALEEIKTKSADVYNETIKPVLTEWHTKYDANGNKIPDPTTINHVDEVLKQVGDK